MSPNRLLPCLLLFSMTAIAACVAPSDRAQLAKPDRATFSPVAQFMAHRCGSLDCHGSIYRNLRVFGSEGLRLNSGDRHVVVPTTSAEVDESFLSLVSLEPEALAAVTSDRGANPERLSLIRKARGFDDHKGWIVMSEGDDQDRCLKSWLANDTDAAACARAVALP